MVVKFEGFSDLLARRVRAFILPASTGSARFLGLFPEHHAEESLYHVGVAVRTVDRDVGHDAHLTFADDLHELQQGVALGTEGFHAGTIRLRVGVAGGAEARDLGFTGRVLHAGMGRQLGNVHALLRAADLLLKCAEELRSSVNMSSLFVVFRSEERLKAVLRKARSILAADSTFFSATSPHQRVAGDELPVRSARQFIQTAMKPTPGQLLTVQECFAAFLAFCQSRGLAAGEQRAFRQFISDIIREEFGMAFRKDLKSADGRYVRGWKGLTVEVAGRGWRAWRDGLCELCVEVQRAWVEEDRGLGLGGYGERWQPPHPEGHLTLAEADGEFGKYLQFENTLLNDNPLIGDDGNSGRGRDALLRPCRECGPTAIFSRRTDDSGLVVLLANPSQ